MDLGNKHRLSERQVFLTIVRDLNMYKPLNTISFWDIYFKMFYKFK